MRYCLPLLLGLMFISAIERQATAEPASTCTPIAIVEGDAAVVDVVRSTLKEQGIAVTPKQDCPSVKAHVTQSESGIVLRVEDAFGRKSERTVIGPEAAAAIIESWARGDLSLPLIMPPSAGAVQQPGADDKETPSSPPSPVARIDIGAEVSGGFEGSIWFGGKLAGCYVLGPTCLGLLTRIAADSALLGDSKRMDTHRTFFSLLATLGFPIQLNRFTALPALGVGASWQKLSRYAKAFNEEEWYFERFIETDSWDWVIEGQLYGALDLGRGFFLLFGVAVDLLPLTNTDPIAHEEFLIAGKPRGHVRGTVGLSYGL